MEFGKWYKKKLKQDLKQLADMCCMVQDVIAIKVCCKMDILLISYFKMYSLKCVG